MPPNVIRLDQNAQIKRLFTVSREDMPTVEGADSGDFVIKGCFASDVPVEEWAMGDVCMCTLGLEDGEYDISRLLNGGTTLFNHDKDAPTGYVREMLPIATVDGHKELQGKIFISAEAKLESGASIREMIKDGSLKYFSLSFSVSECVLTKVSEDAQNECRYTKWEAIEVSVVSVPADVTAGMRTRETAPVNSIRIFAEEGKAKMPEVTNEELAEQLTAKRQKRASHITEWMSAIGKLDDAAELVRSSLDGEALDAKLRELATSSLNAAPKFNGVVDGMSRNEHDQYSIARAISAASTGRWENATLEKEVSAQMERQSGKQLSAGEIMIPFDTFARMLMRKNRTFPTTANSFSTLALGGALKAPPVEIGFADILYNETVLGKLGVQVTSGAVGDVEIFRRKSGASTYWLGDATDLTDGANTFGLIKAQKRTMGCIVPISHSLLTQSTMAEQVIADGIFQAMKVEAENVVFNGKGGSQPLGIMNMPATASGAAIDVDKVQVLTTTSLTKIIFDKLQFCLDAAKVPESEQNVAYCISPTTKQLLTTVAVGTASGRYIYPVLGEPPVYMGKPLVMSTLMPDSTPGTTGSLILAAWNRLQVIMWEGITLQTNPNGRMFPSGGVEVRGLMGMDVIAKNPSTIVRSAAVSL